MKCRLTLLALAAVLAGCGNEESQRPVAQTAAVTSADSSANAVPARTYEQLLAAADEHIKNRQFNAAVRELSQAIAQDPSQTAAYLKRAAICSEAKLLAQAIADMTAAIRLTPDDAKLLNTRGYFLLLSKQYDRAESDFSDAIGIDLMYAQPYNNRGLIWVAQGKYKQAIQDFDNALKAKPDYLDAHNNRGFALLQTDQAQAAVEAFTRVLELDSKYLNALTNRARAHLKLNQPVNAIADFTAAIELEPDTPQHYASRAEAYLADGNQSAAAKDLAHVEWLQTLADLNLRIARSPRDADTWSARGLHLLAEHRLEEASQSFQNALTVVPDHLQALIGRAKLELENGEYAATISDCTEILKRDHSYETLSLRGDAQFALENYGEAIADYEAARRFDERVADAYRRRAAQFRERGDDDLAKADEQFAAGLEKRFTEANVALEKSAPREVVIEQASYEAPPSAPAKPAPAPEK